jgi:hypothetical protein
MNKIIGIILCALVLSNSYTGSTTAVVSLVGGVIKGSSVEVKIKYKRKDCPVCKGKGWYMSGDGIKKVQCGYCEPDKVSSSQSENCDSDKCKTRVIKR